MQGVGSIPTIPKGAILMTDQQQLYVDSHMARIANLIARRGAKIEATPTGYAVRRADGKLSPSLPLYDLLVKLANDLDQRGLA